MPEQRIAVLETKVDAVQYTLKSLTDEVGKLHDVVLNLNKDLNNGLTETVGRINIKVNSHESSLAKLVTACDDLKRSPQNRTREDDPKEGEKVRQKFKDLSRAKQISIIIGVLVFIKFDVQGFILSMWNALMTSSGLQ